VIVRATHAANVPDRRIASDCRTAIFGPRTTLAAASGTPPSNECDRFYRRRIEGVLWLQG
jgi:hypothetical protein